jgi:hypothetical protein
MTQRSRSSISKALERQYVDWLHVILLGCKYDSSQHDASWIDSSQDIHYWVRFVLKTFLSPLNATEKLVFLKSSTIHRNLSEQNASRIDSSQSQFASNSVKLAATNKFYNKTSPVLYVHSTIHRSTIHRGPIHRKVDPFQGRFIEGRFIAGSTHRGSIHRGSMNQSAMNRPCNESTL